MSAARSLDSLKSQAEGLTCRSRAFIDGAYVDAAGGATFDCVSPVGGYKRSGFGRDKSLHAMEKCTQLKSTWIQLN